MVVGPPFVGLRHARLGDSDSASVVWEERGGGEAGGSDEKVPSCLEKSTLISCSSSSVWDQRKKEMKKKRKKKAGRVLFAALAMVGVFFRCCLFVSVGS
ncbi:hypothetical protein IF1G_10296 [Cordyceps javanica]|uniref:Uncharacterized protein n=1 Tax=Cordyceps javanica TaxID=43265 RepID=A0A545UNN8_9HYPO|nr:hypothetical protein IF1G_10296 [Cordyceps javanica]